MSPLNSTRFTAAQIRRGLVLLGAIVLLRAVLWGLVWEQPDSATAPLEFGLLVIVTSLIGSIGLVYVGFTRWVGVDLKG